MTQTPVPCSIVILKHDTESGGTTMNMCGSCHRDAETLRKNGELSLSNLIYA